MSRSRHASGPTSCAVSADETIEAARVAAFLAWDYGAMRGATAVASGWLQRARRLIAELERTAEHCWLLLIEASFHLDTDAGAVLRLSREAGEQARALSAVDIEMTAHHPPGPGVGQPGARARGNPAPRRGHGRRDGR